MGRPHASPVTVSPRTPDASIFSSVKDYVIAAWATAVLGLLLSLGAFWMIHQQLKAHKLLEFKWVAENRNRILNKEINSELEAIESVRDLFLVSERVSREDFGALARTLMQRHRGIQGLVWVPSTPARKNRTSPPAAGPALPAAPPPLMEMPPRTGNTTSGHRDGNFPTLYTESCPGTDPAVSFDYSSVPGYLELMQRARDTGKMVISKRIELAHGRERRFGFAAFLPVYKGGRAADQEARRNHLLGYALGIYCVSTLAKTATDVLEPRGVEFLILDESAPEDERFLAFYSSRLSSPSLSSPGDWQAWQRQTEPRLTQTLSLGDRQWSATYVPTAQFRSAEGFQQGSWVVLTSGFTVTVLLTLYLLRVEQGVRVREKMEHALREREELFRQMTEAIQEVFWIQTPDCSEVLYVSPAYEKIWGRSCESLYQEPCSFLEGIHPDDRNEVDATMRRIPDGEAEQVFRVVKPGGTTRWVRSRAFTVYNEAGEVYRIAGIREDITEIKQAEEALRKSEKQLRSLFFQSPDLIKTVDETGRILSMNRALPNIPMEEAVGLNCTELLPPEYRKRFKKALKRVFRKGKIDHFQYATVDSAWWETRIVPFRRDDEVIEAMVIETDVTETKTLQAQAIRNARLASLGVLAAGVAHEINNPNNAIQFNASVLARFLDDALPVIERFREENGDFLLGGMPVERALATAPRLSEGIRNGSLRIQKIIGNLKHMSRHDKGDLSRKVDILEVLQAAFSILRNQIQKYTDHFVLDLPDTLPSIRGNEQQLEQVFINIVMNALQGLSDRAQSVQVSGFLDEACEYILILVRDEGRGIPEDKISKVTEPFFTTREESGGTGLGMSISDTIIRNHKGKIEISSELGVGTTVTVKLPVKSEKAKAA